MTNKMLKRLLIIFAALSLVLALFPAVALAQEEEGDEGDTTTEVVEETEAEEEAAEEVASDEEESDGLEALGINLGFLIGQIVNISVLFIVLRAILWGPAVNMLNTRQAKIQKGLEDAAAASRARENAEAEAEKILQEARAERQSIMDEARSQAEEVKKTIESEARQEAERIRTEANSDAETAKSAALADVRDDVIKISTAMAGRILGESMDQKKNGEMVSNFLSDLPADASSLSGAIEITSAMPLTDAEKKKVESALSGDSYSYNVDPSILGGLVVRSDDKIIDGSVRGSLDGVSGNLK